MIGFDTIGNATLICYDGTPVLATDPWISGPAYFGSWILSHQIPEEQASAIRNAEFIWLSHGHPDHLSSESLDQLRSSKLLIADHVGARMHKDLTESGYDVKVLPDRKWVDLSNAIRVMCIADFNQDSVLLVDVGGRLVVNTNDAIPANGWGRFVTKIVRSFEKSFLIALSGHGDADMINFWNEDGEQVPPIGDQQLVGRQISQMLQQSGAGAFIPFSSMHRYQRADSVWANDYVTQLSDYPRGFDHDAGALLPPFIRYDCESDLYVEINPPINLARPVAPEEFGDSWSDTLDAADEAKISAYVRAVEHLTESWDFIQFRVGGRELDVALSARDFKRGITFEVPRNSLMTAIEYSVFDDLLIGNFMKTTFHGCRENSLYPDFSPYVAKYSDNGGARTRSELAEYFRLYRQRAPLDHLYHALEEQSKSIFRRFASPESAVYRGAKSVYLRMTTGRQG